MTARADLRQLAKAATPGPWWYMAYADYEKDAHAEGSRHVPIEGGSLVAGPRSPREVEEAAEVEGDGVYDELMGLSGGDIDLNSDGYFMAAANPQTVLRLLDLLDAAEADRDRYRARLHQLGESTVLIDMPGSGIET